MKDKKAHFFRKEKWKMGEKTTEEEMLDELLNALIEIEIPRKNFDEVSDVKKGTINWRTI